MVTCTAIHLFCSAAHAADWGRRIGAEGGQAVAAETMRATPQRAASGAPTPKQPIPTESLCARAHNSPMTFVTGELCTY